MRSTDSTGGGGEGGTIRPVAGRGIRWSRPFRPLDLIKQARRISSWAEELRTFGAPEGLVPMAQIFADLARAGWGDGFGVSLGDWKRFGVDSIQELRRRPHGSATPGLWV